MRSNADLCNDIREFISVVGLPDSHVPSLKELSQHGRQDLANIVRRRGYKLIRELLASSINAEINASDEEKGLTGEQDKASVKEEESTGQDENLKDLAEDISLSIEAPVMGENSSSVYIDSNSNSSYENAIANEGATKSLLEKAAMFIQNGELETIEDICFDTLKENVAEVDKGISESPIPAELLSSVSDEESDQVLYRTDAAEEPSESIPSSSQLVAPSTFDNGHVRKNYSSTDQVVSADSDKELDVEAGTTENQIEVNRLKFMLHQKELELSHLKQQIEKEKQALSNLQSKAETEISKAQKLISDKDAELQAAEESLSGLKEVLIEYRGVAQTVEVAGSFNGWHHPVKLDPQPSSSIMDPVGLRNTRLWKSILWLYPGIYEIKFIVDGQWTIDPERESNLMGSIHNNILRVGK